MENGLLIKAAFDGKLFHVLIKCPDIQIFRGALEQNHSANFSLEHYVKSFRIRRFLVRIFPGLNMERYGVSLRIQSKCGKICTRKTPNTDTFHVVFQAKVFQSECGKMRTRKTPNNGTCTRWITAHARGGRALEKCSEHKIVTKNARGRPTNYIKIFFSYVNLMSIIHILFLWTALNYSLRSLKYMIIWLILKFYFINTFKCFCLFGHVLQKKNKKKNDNKKWYTPSNVIERKLVKWSHC